VELVATSGFVKVISLLIARVTMPPRLGVAVAAYRIGDIPTIKTEISV
jgi:hypothetical protein